MDLICKNIKKSYGHVKALVDANMEVKAGEIRAILGGNGSGKSTIAKVLGGIIKKDGGDVFLDGKKITVKSPTDAKNQGFITTSQELSLLDNLTVEENLMLCQLPSKGLFVDQKRVRKESRELLAKYNME